MCIRDRYEDLILLKRHRIVYLSIIYRSPVINVSFQNLGSIDVKSILSGHLHGIATAGYDTADILSAVPAKYDH